jgi:endonuclease/exonuclease/phosphatase family metal-dependent hydrolase/regulation of enolase protein 1 (concanavalin A-like superfamily)
LKKVIWFAIGFLALMPVTASAQSTLRVVTWNIRHGFEGGPTESVRNLDGQTTLLASFNPQVIVLNEVLSVPYDDVSTYKNQLEAKTGATWYSFYVRTDKGCLCDGPMVLSRIPFDLPPNWIRLDGSQYDSSVIHGQITFNGVPIHVFGTHLSFDPSIRRTQIDTTAAFMDDYAGPRIIGGDFNMERSSADYPYTLAKGYTDVWSDYYHQTANEPATNQDGRIIDYWFRSTDQASNLVPTNTFVQTTTLSDHSPVIADFGVQSGAGTLPTPWLSQDIGSVGQAGSASYANGTFTVNASGDDIWGTADSFRYVYQSLNGDGTIVARVSSLPQNANHFAKAGVMIRETLSPGSAHVILDVLPNGALEFMTRPATGGATTFLSTATQALPTWVKLMRAGSQVTAYVSATGTSWTEVGTTSLSISANAYIGFIVCAHDATLITSTFDNVTVSGPGNVVVYAGDVAPSALHGTWSQAADATSPNSLKLVTSDTGASSLDNPLAAPVDYFDVTFTAQANTPYTLWLRLQALNNSKFNDSLWVQFSDAQEGGLSRYPINSTSGLLVNLATDANATSLNHWGWTHTAYWLTQPTTLTFPTSGAHTLRIQIREDGVQVDQIVLSPTNYLSSPPGGPTNDSTIVPKP